MNGISPSSLLSTSFWSRSYARIATSFVFLTVFWASFEMGTVFSASTLHSASLFMFTC